MRASSQTAWQDLLSGQLHLSLTASCGIWPATCSFCSLHSSAMRCTATAPGFGVCACQKPDAELVKPPHARDEPCTTCTVISRITRRVAPSGCCIRDRTPYLNHHSFLGNDDACSISTFVNCPTTPAGPPGMETGNDDACSISTFVDCPTTPAGPPGMETHSALVFAAPMLSKASW